MKNFLMIACVAVCTVFMAGNTSYAIGGGNGGGGGKVASSARVVMTNTESTGGVPVAAWVRLAGTNVPSTLGALRDQLIFMGPGETRQTNNLRNGNYIITTVDVRNIQLPDSTPIDQAAINSVEIDSSSFEINGVDRTVNVSGSGIGFTN